MCSDTPDHRPLFRVPNSEVRSTPSSTDRTLPIVSSMTLTTTQVLYSSLLLIPLSILSYTLYRRPNATAKSEMPYGLWHLSLNKLPGESDEELPKTEWLNMGYWKVRLYSDQIAKG